MKRIIYVLLMISLSLKAHSQFNTIKKIKTLPLIQINSTGENNHLPGQLFSSSLKDSVTFLIKKSNSALVSLPLVALFINSDYGYRLDPITREINFHSGIDFKGSGKPVMTIMAGRVTQVAYSRGLGNYIEIQHGDFSSIYGHLSSILVQEKMELKSGTVIGVTGNTGQSTGDHLHFALKYKGRIINPAPFLDEIYRTLKLHPRKTKTTLTNF